MIFIPDGTKPEVIGSQGYTKELIQDLVQE